MIRAHLNSRSITETIGVASVWLAVSYLSALIGITVASATGIFTFRLVYLKAIRTQPANIVYFDTAIMVVLAIAGAVGGMCAGLIQQRALIKIRGEPVPAWVWKTTLLWLILGAMVPVHWTDVWSGMPLPPFPLSKILLLVTVSGAAQWWFSRRWLDRPAVWSALHSTGLFAAIALHGWITISPSWGQTPPLFFLCTNFVCR